MTRDYTGKQLWLGNLLIDSRGTVYRVSEILEHDQHGIAYCWRQKYDKKQEFWCRSQPEQELVLVSLCFAVDNVEYGTDVRDLYQKLFDTHLAESTRAELRARKQRAQNHIESVKRNSQLL